MTGADDLRFDTQFQAADLTLDDFRGLAGCNELLDEARTDGIETKYVRLQSG